MNTWREHQQHTIHVCTYIFVQYVLRIAHGEHSLQKKLKKHGDTESSVLLFVLCVAVV